MKHLHKLIFAALILSSCSATSSVQQDAYTEDQLYQGYPCLDECEAFKVGYDQARKSHLTEASNCSGASIKEIAGCRAYVNDYNFDNRTFEELLSDL